MRAGGERLLPRSAPRVHERVLWAPLSDGAKVTWLWSYYTQTPLTAAAVRQRGVSFRTLQRHCEELQMHGFVRSVRRGEWEVAAAGVGAASALKQVVAEATQEHTKAATARRERPATMASRAARPKYAAADRAMALVEHLRFEVKNRLGSVAQPLNTGKSRKAMQRLRDEYGGDQVRSLIEFVTTPAHWQALQRRFRFTAPIPTPALLLGFHDSFFALMGDPAFGVPPRSGGAGGTPTDTLADF